MLLGLTALSLAGRWRATHSLGIEKPKRDVTDENGMLKCLHEPGTNSADCMCLFLV